MSCCNSTHSHVPCPNILAVIFDLDGTLLDTETATRDVMKELLAKYGKTYDKEKEEKKTFGKTMKESSVRIVHDYDLPLTPDQYIQEIIPMYQHKWRYAKALPGVNRLIKHLHDHGIPLALASNSLREYVDQKISHQKGWKEYFSVILGSDQVKEGKPSPYLFKEAAKRLNVDANHCLVIEDSLVGVKAGNAAKMAVVAVPSRVESACVSLANTTLHSLLEFRPELWGLPPFQDWIDNALPIEPICTNGLYSNGILHDLTDDDDGIYCLPDQVFGVFFGFAEDYEQKIFNVIAWIGHDQCSCNHQKKMVKIFIVDEANVCESNQKMKIELLGYIKELPNKGSINTCMETEILEECKSIARASSALQVFTQSSQILSEGNS